MKRIATVIAILLITTATTLAQRPGQRIHAAKIAYIVDRLHLSPRQAADFTPVYDDFEREIKETRVYFFRKYKGADPGTSDDSTSLQFVDDNLDYQQRVIEIRRRYNERFLKIISARQLSELSVAEREFKQMLIRQLERQRGHGGPYRGRSRYY